MQMEYMKFKLHTKCHFAYGTMCHVHNMCSGIHDNMRSVIIHMVMCEVS